MHDLSKLFVPSSTTGRGVLVVAVIAVIGLFALIPLLAYPRPAPRELVLVVRDMTFYVEGSDVANPTLRLKPGEEVRIILRNEQPGMTHDFVVASLHASIAPLRGMATGSVSLRAPEQRGRYEYRCTPHSRMMNGILLIE